MISGELTIPKHDRYRGWTHGLRRCLQAFFITLALLAIGGGDYRPSQLDLAAAPHRYSILDWELTHFSHKWARELAALWPPRRDLSREDQLSLVTNFFEWGRLQRDMEARLLRARLDDRTLADGKAAGVPDVAAQLSRALDRNRERRQALLPEVEGIVENELSRLLAREGFTTRWIGVFPPVDVVFGTPPTILVLSPRDRIHRQDTTLLRPGLEDSVKEDLERLALETENLSAVVERTGGLSVYPSVVLDTAGLRFALEAAAHEWVHHWLFFRPLGRNYQKSPEMLTLNETAATIAGEELGDRTYTALTGEEVTRPWVGQERGGFDFTSEMRETRRGAEELLASGDIEGAEAYMEERRRIFVAEGYNIRKINQAYFAFYGSYATGAGSVSPIGEQVKELRRSSGSLKEFLETMAQFGSYEEYLEYWEALMGDTSAQPGPAEGQLPQG